MRLSETGESRLRGYLFVLERSLKASPVSRDIAADAVREVESHIRDQVAEMDSSVDERSALENILTRLGPPATVAQGYSLELVIDEAVTTGGAVAVGRALFRLATTGMIGFFAVLGLFVGYVTGVSFLMMAVLKPIFPANVGIWMRNGVPRSVGAQFPAPTGMELVGGYWVVPAALLVGFGALVVTHLLARRWIAWTRSRLERPKYRR
jgi:uncharacterized membrane protein